MTNVVALYDAPDTSSALTRPLCLTWVAAGFPSPADDHLDRDLDLHELLIQHPAAAGCHGVALVQADPNPARVNPGGVGVVRGAGRREVATPGSDDESGHGVRRDQPVRGQSALLGQPRDGEPEWYSADVVISRTVTCQVQDIWDEARHIMARSRAPDEVDDSVARWYTEPRVLITVTPERIATRGTSRRYACEALTVLTAA